MVSQKASPTSFFRKAGEESSFFGAQEANSFFSPPVQAKLSVSSPDDPQEKEADAVADQVMRMTDSTPSVSGKEEEKKVHTKPEIPVIHRSVEKDGQEELHAKLTPDIQRSADAFGDAENSPKPGEAFLSSQVYRKPISLHRSSILKRSGRAPPKEEPSFDQQLASKRGGGSAMPSSTKQFMENRFSADFSGVRIHTGGYAANMSSAIQAQAFTHGNDIYFNHGKYAPDTASGGALLAHELTHTIQQGASTQGAKSSTPASSSLSRKPIIQRSAEGSVPQLTNAVELAKSKEGKVNANKEGPDGNREGWQDLVDFFKTTFGEDKIVSGSGGSAVPGAIAEADIKKKRITTGTIVNPQDINGDRISGKRDAMPSWCGIFVFWALNKSGVPMPKWKLGESIIKPESAYPPGHVPKVGDIAYKEGYSHYAMVERADASTVRTVNGNTSGEDNLGAQIQTRDHPMSNWTGFFNPLLNMEGSLGAGEGTSGSVPKSLRELRKELFKVDRKEEAGEQEQIVQAKPELSKWSVDSEGGLQTKPAAGSPENIIQTKDEDKKEDEKQKAASPTLQRKAIFDIHRVCDCEETHEQDAQSETQVQLKSDALATSLKSSYTRSDSQSSGITQNRGPPSLSSEGSDIVQRSVIDDALNYIGSVTDCITLDLDEAKRCGLQKAQQVALHIPGYRALRVVLGSDPITGEGVERNGRNFIEAAFDIMPGGELLHRKLDEIHLLDSAAEWIDTQIASLESIVDDLFDRFDAFWGRLGVSDFTSPMEVLREGASIVLDFINNVIDFAVDAAVELLTRIKDYLLEKIVDFIKEETTAYPLLCVILGRDPITEEEVAPTGTNILNALLELGGEEGVKQRTQMEETGTFQRIVGYIDEGISVFSGAYQRIVQGFKNIWDRVSIESLMDPVGTFTDIYNEFAAPIQEVWDFVTRVGAEILKLIKEVLMQRLSAWARTVRGFSLVTVIIGKDPFTDQEVPFTMENVIKGFFSLMEGGEEQYNQLKESGAIDRTVAKITAAVARLNMTPSAIVQLFIDLWNSFSLDDLMNPIAAFQRIIAKFGEPIGRLIAFVIEIIMIVIEAILIVMNFPFDLINNIIAKAMQAYQMIKRDPVGFLKNLLRAIKQGFIQFFDNILQHLLTGLVGWLTSELRDAGVPTFTDTSLRGIISWVLQVLGISMEKIWEKLAAHPRIGPERVARIRSMINTLEGIWTFIRDVQERGVAAIWDKIQEQLSNLWNTILDAVKNWIMEQIVNRMITRLLSMLDPTGIMAVVNSVIAFYNAVQSFIKYLREMLEIVNSFVEGVVDIASGNITTAANYLEQTMARAVPIVIGFLANQVGLSGIGQRIGEMIGRAQEMVDEALTWLVNRAVDTAFSVIDRLMGRGGEGEAPPDGGANDQNFEVSAPMHMTTASHTLKGVVANNRLEFVLHSDPVVLEPTLVRIIASMPSTNPNKNILEIALTQVREIEHDYQDNENDILHNVARNPEAEKAAKEAYILRRQAEISNMLEQAAQLFNITELQAFFAAAPSQRYIPRASQQEVGNYIRSNLYDSMHSWTSNRNSYVDARKPALIARINGIKSAENQNGWQALKTEGVIDPDANITTYDPSTITYAVDHITPVAQLWNQEGADSDDSARRSHFLDQSNWQILTQRVNSGKSSGGIQYRRYVGPNFVSSLADGGASHAKRISGQNFWDANNQPIN